jgi:hypothetical protein
MGNTHHHALVLPQRAALRGHRRINSTGLQGGSCASCCRNHRDIMGAGPRSDVSRAIDSGSAVSAEGEGELMPILLDCEDDDGDNRQWLLY